MSSWFYDAMREDPEYKKMKRQLGTARNALGMVLQYLWLREQDRIKRGEHEVYTKALRAYKRAGGKTNDE